MKQVKGLLFDIGGVLYVSDVPIVGAIETIEKLRLDYPMRFLTNSTRRTPEMILQKLLKMGFDVKNEALFTALNASKAYVKARNGSVYPVMTDEAEAFFADLCSDSPDFVVVGDAYTNFEYHKLNEAFRHLLNGAKLIAAAKNRYFKDKDNKLSLDAGGFIQTLEFAADVEGMIIGKPSRAFFHLAVDSMNLKPEEVLMIGDDIVSDIKGAQDAGLKAALVKTGKFQVSDLQRDIMPDLILQDVAELPLFLKRQF